MVAQLEDNSANKQKENLDISEERIKEYWVDIGYKQAAYTLTSAILVRKSTIILLV